MEGMTFKSGDRPPVYADLTDHDPITDAEVPLNLAGATVAFLMRDISGGAPDVNAAAVVVGDPTLGHVRYDWAVGQTDVPGEYEASFKVTFASGISQTFPNDDFIPIVIEASIGSGLAPTLPALPDLCWPVDEGCCKLDDYALSVRNRAKVLAGQTMHMLTGRRVGGCAVTIRPCAAQWCDLNGYFWADSYYMPYNFSGQWSNLRCGCLNACYHGKVGVRLPGPVGRIDAVRVDGVVLDPAAYWLDGNVLVRADGTDWPQSQNLNAAVTATGTFAVTYLNAYPVDALGAYAAGVLACEYAKACSGDKACRLPSAVTQVARAGITMTVTPGSFPNGLTGIREVDAYIEAWNPNHLRSAPRVWTPSR